MAVLYRNQTLFCHVCIYMEAVECITSVPLHFDYPWNMQQNKCLMSTHSYIDLGKWLSHSLPPPPTLFPILHFPYFIINNHFPSTLLSPIPSSVHTSSQNGSSQNGRRIIIIPLFFEVPSYIYSHVQCHDGGSQHKATYTLWQDCHCLQSALWVHSRILTQGGYMQGKISVLNGWQRLWLPYFNSMFRVHVHAAYIITYRSGSSEWGAP